MIHQLISLNNSWSVACLQSVCLEHIDSWNSSCFGWMQGMFPRWGCSTFGIFLSFFSRAISLHYQFQLDFAQEFCNINFIISLILILMRALLAEKVTIRLPTKNECKRICNTGMDKFLSIPEWIFPQSQAELTRLCCRFCMILLLITLL